MVIAESQKVVLLTLDGRQCYVRQWCKQEDGDDPEGKPIVVEGPREEDQEKPKGEECREENEFIEWIHADTSGKKCLVIIVGVRMCSLCAGLEVRYKEKRKRII